MKVEWYFDFISPFVHLQLMRLPDLPSDLDIEFKPLLFAALLNHFGQLGPAEIESKRLFTYRHVQWLGQKMDFPLRLPKAHPFNSLPLLRLAIADGCRYENLCRISEFVWRHGHIPEETDEFMKLAKELGYDDPVVIKSDKVKSALRKNSEDAIAAGVFGVPSFVVDKKVFWGLDATQMLIDYHDNPALFDNDDMQRLETLPSAAKRIPKTGS